MLSYTKTEIGLLICKGASAMCSSHTAKELNLKFNQLYRRQCNLYHTYAAACHLSDTAFSILYCLCETEAD